MDLGKLFQKKADNDTGKAQRPKAVKKDATQPPAAKLKKAESAKKLPKKPEESGPPWWERLRQYLREVVYELRKVVWPSRKETIGTTSVVLVIVLVMGAYLGIVDLILSRLIRLFLG
jgi:preprotein translocase subunit SecE